MWGNVKSTCLRKSFTYSMLVAQFEPSWKHLVHELVALNECVMKTTMKHHYLQHLQESNANPKLFPSPVVTR
ncbi:hypothetical protein PR048_009358 [Dryococelus australis]|uniref:Uncharacterized protein n=1 Tax=Dryococelus australis TaxID=614101 RepID=A0ABQ9I1H4_9NEOP|nr:hypothetical protein PR048_009358 [Dryococelus australis]